MCCACQCLFGGPEPVVRSVPCPHNDVCAFTLPSVPDLHFSLSSRYLSHTRTLVSRDILAMPVWCLRVFACRLTKQCIFVFVSPVSFYTNRWHRVGRPFHLTRPGHWQPQPLAATTTRSCLATTTRLTPALTRLWLVYCWTVAACTASGKDLGCCHH